MKKMTKGGLMRRINRRVVVTVTLCALAAISASAQRTPDLDMTILDRPAVDVNPDESSRSVVALPALDGRKIEDFLRIRLVSLEPSACVYGDSLSYELELSNEGRIALLLPWSVNPRDQGEAADGFYPIMSLSLEYQEGRSRGVLDAGNLLFGDRFGTFSTRTLRPKQSVVIRAAGKCGEVGGTQASFAPASRRLKVTARIGLNYGESALGPTTVSNNSQELTLNWPN